VVAVPLARSPRVRTVAGVGYDQMEWWKRVEPVAQDWPLQRPCGSGVSVSVGGGWEDMNGHGLQPRGQD
jgi:hypothetical protein